MLWCLTVFPGGQSVARTMKGYDLITIFANDDKLDDSKKAVQEILARHKAEVVKEDDWGIRTLYYERKDKASGFFYHCNFKIDPTQVKEITRELNIQNGILQFMFHRAA